MHTKLPTVIGIAVVAAMAVPSGGPRADRGAPDPTLVGRAVLPVETYAPGPTSGKFFDGQTINGIEFELPSQPVQGFSAILDGRERGEYLAMPDNGFGNKLNSRDFLIRAYFVRPDFKTARGGSGTVEVRDFIQFRDPDRLIGFSIVNEATSDRWLTGGDIDPESLQRAKNGDLWMGDEFGPWVLHFDATGKLLDPPFPAPGGLRSPSHPQLGGADPTQPGSRGFEAMAVSPDGKYLYATLEGATVADLVAGAPGAEPTRRHVYEFSIRDEAFTGNTWEYHTESAAYLVSDMAALDRHHFVVIERDGGRGLGAAFRRVYVVNLEKVGADGALVKTEAVDLAAVPDPDLISLPPIHAGDVGLGDPFRVTCESIEAILPISGTKLLLGCDNNFPNKGRNPGEPDSPGFPGLADDNEFIVVKVPGLRAPQRSGASV